MIPFVIMALPRSRTTWLSQFLSYPPHRCGHDIAIECESIADFEWFFKQGGLSGTAETGAMYGWKVVQRRMPAAKIIVITRPVAEVYESFRKLGLFVPPGEFEPKAIMLQELSRQPGVVTLPYSSLQSEEVLRTLFEYCLGIRCPDAWYRRFEGTNIQVDIAAQLAYIETNRTRIERFKAEVAREVDTYRL
jgi:hypothetical protein